MGTKHTPGPWDHVALVQEYADIRRGERPGWEGDSVANGESFAFRLGYGSPDDAMELVRSLGINETQYALLTGLPPGSLRRMSARLRAGASAARAAIAKATGGA